MSNMTFADRYASAGLAPTPALIVSREEPAKRIVQSIDKLKTLGLVSIYFGNVGHDLTWFRDEFRKDDPSFSLINNQNETILLAALVLSELILAGKPIAILALIAGSVAGLRKPQDCEWLLQQAKQKALDLSVAEREPVEFEPKLTFTPTAKLKDEVAGLGEGDWPTLIALLGKIRTESHQSLTAISNQAAGALSALKKGNSNLREESQMLWWIFGGHSSSLERNFNTLTPNQAAIVSAIDLGNLTTSHYGPIAAPAMLERILGLAKRPAKNALISELDKTLDSIPKGDLNKLEINHQALPPQIAPIATAIELSRSLGVGAWGNLFTEKTGLSSSIELPPLELAEQLYYEHLLGQFL